MLTLSQRLIGARLVSIELLLLDMTNRQVRPGKTPSWGPFRARSCLLAVGGRHRNGDDAIYSNREPSHEHAATSAGRGPSDEVHRHSFALDPRRWDRVRLLSPDRPAHRGPRLRASSLRVCGAWASFGRRR